MTDRAWNNPADITYCVGNIPAEWADAMRRAFSEEVWGGKSGAKFRDVSSIFDAVIIIAFYGSTSFDLQTAYNSPNWDNTGDHPGQTHGWNIIQVRSDGPGGGGWAGWDLNRAVAHEVGHALGFIDHSTTATDLMGPYYGSQPANGVPTENDIARLQALYGPGTNAPMQLSLDTQALTLAITENGATTNYTLTPSNNPPPGDKVIDAPTTDTVTDGNSDVWSFTSTYQAGVGYGIAKNGSEFAATFSRAIRLGVKQGRVYSRGENGQWYHWSGSSFDPIGNDPFA